MASLDSAGFSDPFASAKTRQVIVPFIPLKSVVYLRETARDAPPGWHESRPDTCTTASEPALTAHTLFPPGCGQDEQHHCYVHPVETGAGSSGQCALVNTALTSAPGSKCGGAQNALCGSNFCVCGAGHTGLMWVPASLRSPRTRKASSGLGRLCAFRRLLRRRRIRHRCLHHVPGFL
jgi:hypothetical protein